MNSKLKKYRLYLQTMKKKTISNKQKFYLVVFEYLLGDKAGWLRFWLFLLIVLSFIFLGVVLDRSIGLALRWGAIPVAALLIAWIVGASYIEDIYELESYGACLNYLWSIIFGFSPPTLKISNGQIDLDAKNVNTLSKIGGPGILLIESGNAVILETLYGPSRILGVGEHRVSRFEIIKDVVSLEEQFGRIDEIPAVTRDGLDVTVTDVTYGYCVYRAQQEKSSNNPYPFAEEGIYNMAYRRGVNDKGQLGSWSDSVQSIIKSVIVGYIAGKDLDALTAPSAHEGYPLDALRNEFGAKAQRRLKDIGAQLEWHNIGSLNVNSMEVSASVVKVRKSSK